VDLLLDTNASLWLGRRLARPFLWRSFGLKCIPVKKPPSDEAAPLNRKRFNEASVDIDEIRKRIDLLDDALLRLFNERARLALEIGHLKKELGLPVFDPAREKRILARMKGENPGPLDDGAIVRLFERVVDESRRLERIRSQEEGRGEC